MRRIPFKFPNAHEDVQFDADSSCNRPIALNILPLQIEAGLASQCPTFMKEVV